MFVHDRETGETFRVSVDSQEQQGDGVSRNASINTNGCSVAFESVAPNLVGNDTNAKFDIFVRNWCLGNTKRVSVSTPGAAGQRG